MKLAFCLYKFFPYGGLERDFFKIATVCHNRGYSIHVFTMKWEGDIPLHFDVTIIPVKFWTNHGKIRIFVKRLQPILTHGGFDAIVGFNKMPGIDVYYAADPCYVARIANLKPVLYRLTPRYRHFAGFERAVFGLAAETELMMISDIEKDKFIRFYQTPSERFHLLPPGINPDRKAPENANDIRAQWRTDFRLKNDEKIILMVASAFKTKGLDRAIIALSALPGPLKKKTRLMVVGQDKPKPFQKIARNLGVENKVRFLLGRDDIPKFLLGADLLIHPAYTENTGTVILEAMVAGLPVLITDVCGYAFHVRRAGAGIVVDSPFDQNKFNRVLKDMLTTDEANVWSQNGIQYGRTEDLYSLPEIAADLIESIARKTQRA